MTRSKIPHRVLVVSNFFPPQTVGGAELVAHRQARALAARGHHVVVLAGATGASEANPAGSLGHDVHDGLPVYRLVMRSFEAGQNFHWPAAARRVAGLIAAHDLDAVLFHNLNGLGTDMVLAARRAGARCLVTLHDHWGHCFRATRLRTDGRICADHERCADCQATIVDPAGAVLPMRLRRDYVAWCLGHADRLISPSRYLAQSYQDAGFAPDRLMALSNGIDLGAVPAAKRPAPDGAVRFVCSAYLGEHKGIPVLLEAARRLAAEPRAAGRWHLTIAGDGHLRPAVEKLAAQAGLEGRVRLTGRLPRQEFLALLADTDVIVLPSVWPENEPVSLLEAIASGTAQIATDLGGSAALIEHGRSGYLIAPGDPDALAGAMLRYILDPSLATAHGSHNLSRRDAFDESRTISRLEELLDAPTPAAPADDAAPVVVCGGAASPPPQAEALVRELHAHLPPGPVPRLLWHDWCGAEAWADARLLWLWDRHAHEALFAQALKRGIPVLAPHTGWAEGLARHYGGVILYRTYLEAMAALRALLAMPDLRRAFAARAYGAADASVAMAPRGAFDLRADRAA